MQRRHRRDVEPSVEAICCSQLRMPSSDTANRPGWRRELYEPRARIALAAALGQELVGDPFQLREPIGMARLEGRAIAGPV